MINNLSEKRLIIVAVLLLFVIVGLSYYAYSYRVSTKLYESKSNWYIFGNKFCQSIGDKPSNITYRFLCDGDKLIDIYYDWQDVPRSILYSNASSIDEKKSIEISSYFLDFVKNKELGCNLEDIMFYNQSQYFPYLEKCEEPPEYAYFQRYVCKNFNMSVTVSVDDECSIMGRVSSVFFIDPDEKNAFASNVARCNCNYFEPTAFQCGKYKLFKDRIDFMGCVKPIRGVIYTFNTATERLIFKGVEAVYVQ